MRQLRTNCSGNTITAASQYIQSSQTPPSHKENGLVTIEQFLGCADLAILILNKKLIRWLHDERPVSLVYAHAWMMWRCFIGLSKIKTVDSARPRNRSIVTRPFFPCERVWSGHNYNETTSSKVVLPNKVHVPHICVSEEVSHLTSCHNTYSFGT